MPSVVTIFDHFMKPLTQLDVATTPRSWVLNDVGRCEFTISTTDPKCREEILQYGNLVHIEHIPSVDVDGNTNGKLPDWVGIILPPRTWNTGSLNVAAYSAESIFTIRPMPFMDVTGTPKEIFLAILKQVNAVANNIIIQPGIVEDTGRQSMDSLRVSAYEHVVKLVKNAGMTWSITGQIEASGSLSLFANLYQSRGLRTGYEINNLNAEQDSPLLTEQNIPQNVVVGYSQAQTQNSRYSAKAVHEASFGDYGYMGVNTVFAGLTSSSAVQSAAQSKADALGRPKRILARTALDVDQTFSYLDIENELVVVEQNAGFNPSGGLGFTASVKIISMQYNDLSNKVPLVLEVL